MKLVFGQDKAVIEWVERRIPWMPRGGFGKASAIGIANDSNKPVAGIVYNDLVEAFGTMALSCAADTPMWAKPDIIYACLSFPFDQVGINKLWTATQHDNDMALRVNEHIGFTREGTLRHHFGHKKHAVICSMLKAEFEKKYANIRKLAA